MRTLIAICAPEAADALMEGWCRAWVRRFYARRRRRAIAAYRRELRLERAAKKRNSVR